MAQTLSNPPWKAIVSEILIKNLDDGHKGSLNMSFATIKQGPKPRPSVRTVIFRGFVGESREENEPEKLPGGNPPAQSSLIVVTTDALMPKVSELETSDGVFEVSWWQAGTNQQIRFNGKAHIYRPNPAITFPEEELNKYIDVGKKGGWTWENERERLWRSHRPVMRGSFRNPQPGTLLDDEKRKKLRPVELAADDDGPEAQEAKQRFSLVVLQVLELEILDLDPPPVISHVHPARVFN